MNDQELERWKRNLQRSLDDWHEPEKAKQRRKPNQTGKVRKGLRVRLAVREKQRVTDHVFSFDSTSISPLQARIEAQQAAYDAGWDVVAYVIDYEKI